MSAAITVFIPKVRRSSLLPKRRQNWTSAQLNAQIAQSGFPVVLEQFDPRTQRGFVPGLVDGVRSGFEYYSDSIENYLELIEDMRDEDDFPYSEDEIQRIAGHDQAIQLVFSYRPRQYAAAAVAAASLAALTSGLVLDEPVWKWYSGEAALAWARDVFAKHGSEQPDEP